MKETYDAVIVGSGAAGGMMTHQLAKAGLSILLLEAGPDRTGTGGPASHRDKHDAPPPPKDDLSGRVGAVVEKAKVAVDVLSRSAMEIGTAVSGRPDLQKLIHLRAADEKRVPGSERQMIQQECPVFGKTTAILYVDDVDNPYMHPSSAPYVWIRGRQLGGRTQTWKRMTPRMSDHELKAASRDGIGINWPFSAEEITPYYEIAERRLRVTGSIEAGARSYDGALAARAMSTAETKFASAIRAKWSDRRVSLSPYADPFGASEHGDLDERWDRYDEGRHPSHDCSVRCTIGPALETGKVTVRTNAIVFRVDFDASTGKASGVRFFDAQTREEHQAKGRVVVLCASSLESTRILLNSTCVRWPTGLGNSSGVLGKYLTDHLFGVGAVGVKASKGQRVCQPPMLIQNFRNTLDDKKDHGFARGYQYAGYFGALRGGPFRTWMTTLILSAHGEVIPREENRVSIDPEVKDKWGVPVLRVECYRGENERRMCEDMLQTGCEMLEAAGYETMMKSPEPLAPGASIHEGGTVRMGDDHRTSILNGFARSWDVPNLYVTDCSAFTTAGNQNPVVTIMALNARAAEDIVARMQRREL